MPHATHTSGNSDDNLIHQLSFTGHGGVPLAADIAGAQERPEVILMHGGGQTRHAWNKALSVLSAAGYRVLSLDLRGHGDSGWAGNGDYSLDALCQDLRIVLASCRSRPVLIGASLGGSIALMVAGEDPALASALVLVDVAPRLEQAGVEHIHRFMKAKPMGFASMQEVAQALAVYNPNRPPPTDLQGLKKNLRQRTDGRWYWHWDPAFLAGNHQMRVDEMSQRMRAAARRVAIPTLLVRGQSSDVVSMEGVAELRQLIPHLEFTDIAQAGHMVAGDRNDVFNAAIIEFLRRVAPLPGAGTPRA